MLCSKHNDMAVIILIMATVAAHSRPYEDETYWHSLTGGGDGEGH